MDAARIQQKIYAGNAKAAKRLGYAYVSYRPSGAGNPIVNGNIQQSALLIAPTQKGKFNQPNTYGNAIWWSYHDGRLTQTGDYLVGRDNTFFVASQQDLLQIQLVQCNRVLTFYRVTQPSGVGKVGYGGAVDANDTPLLTAWPASVLQGSKGERNPAGLPLDAKDPWWQCLLPAYPGIELQLTDRVTDELGNRYAIHQAELTDLGWRLKLMQDFP